MRPIFAGTTLAIGLAASVGSADPAAPPEPFRWGVGVEVGVVELPTAHVGIPTGGVTKLPEALTLRYQPAKSWAIDAGIGFPHATGLAVWCGFEGFREITRHPRGLVTFDLFAAPGLQLGFAGPDWAARHENAFVGYGYIYQGPLAFALRFPAGARLRWFDGRLDTYALASPALYLTPSTEVLFGLSIGLQVHFGR